MRKNILGTGAGIGLAAAFLAFSGGASLRPQAPKLEMVLYGAPAMSWSACLARDWISSSGRCAISRSDRAAAQARIMAWPRK